MKVPPYSYDGPVHPWHDIAPGDPKRLPAIVDAVIEIPKNSFHKYELDKRTGLLRLSRVLYSAVHYPANYGFIPQTLTPDGGPLDVLLLGADPIQPLALVTVRVIGVMRMRDGDEVDDKIIAVHVNEPEYSACTDLPSVPQHWLTVLREFFQDYKALENKEVVVKETLPVQSALPTVLRAITAYRRWRDGESMTGLFE